MCPDQGTHTISTKAVEMGPLYDGVEQDAFAELSRFRGEFHSCLTRRGDALFELADTVLCADGPVRSLVDTVLRWHRDLLKRRHAATCAPKRRGRPSTVRSIRALVLRLARENKLVGLPAHPR